MTRRLRAALATLALVAAGVSAQVSAHALGVGGPNPASNIAAAPSLQGSVCDADPLGSACRARVISALDRARHLMGLPSYSLPDRFAYLTQPEKMLVLVNQDRNAYGMSHVYGMNAYLNINAQAGVTQRRDPDPVRTLAGAGWWLWTANWAGGTGAIENPMTAHYDWMYYDGLNPDGTSWNSLCTRVDQTLCWKHRHNVLVTQSPGQQMAIGIGAGADGHGGYGYTHLIETFPTSAPVNYVPSVIRMSSRWAPHGGGKVISVGGFGFVRVSQVTVLGARAKILSVNPWGITVRVPAHAAGKGHLIVNTAGGTSSATYAAAFTYTS